MADDPTQAVADDSTPDPSQAPAPDLSQLMMSVSPDRQAPPNPANIPPPQQTGPPRPGRPILMDLIQGLIKPPSEVDTSTGTTLMRPESRVDTLENFLTNFVGALGTGFSQAGHGPGANLRGAGAAIQAPYQQALQNYSQGQQSQENQARIQQQQAQTGLTQAQTAAMGPAAQAKLASLTPQPRFDPTTGKPLGLMTDATFQSYSKGQGAAATNTAGKITVEEFKSALELGKVARVEDAKDPQTGQLGKMAYDITGQPMGFLPSALPTAALMGKSTTSQQFLQTSPGVWQKVDKTSTTAPIVPGAAPTASGFPRQGAGAPNIGGPSAPSAAPSRTITGSGPIIAFDPKTQERVLTTPTEAQQQGYTQPVAVTENNIEKYRNSAVMFNDVQANVSRFRTAAQAFATQGSPSDAIGINLALNESKIGGGIHLGPAGVEIPGYSSLAEAADRVSRSASYKSLSPAGKNLVDGYFRTMAAVPAYQKALTNIGKSNKEMLDLELANIPNPTLPPNDILRKLDAFQENINHGAAGLPRIAGIPNIRDTRNKFETPKPLDFSIPQPFTGNPFSGNMQGSKQ